MPPPDPPPGEVSYAVNQQAEQIIFEAEPGWVTAHVLIRYAGDPAQFAWIVPVPEVPELAIDRRSRRSACSTTLTAPSISVTTDDICPQSQWACDYHAPPSAARAAPTRPATAGTSSRTPAAGSYDAAPGGGSAGHRDLRADRRRLPDRDVPRERGRRRDAVAARQRLHRQQTTSIYMESYVHANMVFVAAKLVPGAGVKSIKPLRMRYRAAYPTVPLILTAVAAEPNLTVTTFIYSNTLFRPLGHPVVTIDPKRLARDTLGRQNYPQVLARMIDEAGGDGFVYRVPRHRGACRSARATAAAAAHDVLRPRLRRPVRVPGRRLRCAATAARSATSSTASRCCPAARREVLVR